ncbi:MAG: hypothetical protein KDD40_02285 [Bdellovibrionales bacterium]|nr:hypothetical protein [Bdellovibrionales bacterium]
MKSFAVLFILIFTTLVLWAHEDSCPHALEPSIKIVQYDYVQVAFDKSKVAVVDPNYADQLNLEKEMELKQQGITAIIIFAPGPETIDSFTTSRGYHYGPLFVSRRKTPIDLFAEIDQSEKPAKKKAKSRASLRKKLAKTGVGSEDSDYHVELSPLTAEGIYGLKPLYENSVGQRNVSVNTFSDAFIDAKLKQIQEFPNKNFQILVYHKQDGLVGGLIFELIEEGQTAKVWRAAFAKQEPHLSNYLGLRCFYEMNNFALANKIPTLSYGTDANFNGEFLSMGLQKYKSELGLRVAEGELYNHPRLIKILNSQGLENSFMTFSYANNRNASAGYEVHVYGQVSQDYSFPSGIKVHYHNLD